MCGPALCGHGSKSDVLITATEPQQNLTKKHIRVTHQLTNNKGYSNPTSTKEVAVLFA